MQAFGKGKEAPFKFAANDSVHAERVEMIGIQWRVKPIRANMRSRIQLQQARNSMRRDSCRGVHRQVKRDQVGPTHNVFVLAQGFLREVQLINSRSALAQPGRGRSQAKRLMAEVIGRDQNDIKISQQSGRIVPSLRSLTIRCECPVKASKIGTILSVS
jgi:hypothetical protein